MHTSVIFSGLLVAKKHIRVINQQPAFMPAYSLNFLKTINQNFFFQVFTN